MGINKIPLGPADFRHREKTPLYARLQTRLQKLIESGYWKPNDQLPTERELATATGISINTVKTALHNLVLEGYVHRRQGSGTFVTSPVNFFGLHRYYGMQEDLGAALERHRKIFLSRTRETVPDDLVKHFALGAPVEAFRLERVLCVGGVKTVHTISFLPVSLFSGFEDIPKDDIEELPLYHILSSNFNMPCRVSKEVLAVRNIPDHIAEILEVEKGTPVLYSKILAQSYDQKPFEIRISHILTNNYYLYREI